MPSSASPYPARKEENSTETPIVVACVTNENYSLGTAVTIRSLLERCRPGSCVRVVVIADDVRPETAALLQSSWEGFGAVVSFVKPDRAKVSMLKCERGMQHETYFRLLIGELLPEHHRVLFLDSDLVILRDIFSLWETDLGPFVLGAVRHMVGNTTLSCIPHSESIGLDPQAPYFSTGVMLIDLHRWRDQRIGERAIEHAAMHPECIKWEEQDALNAVLQGKFSPLDPRWNMYSEAVSLLGLHRPPHEQAHWQWLSDTQYLCHFGTRFKPWKYACPHPRTQLFYDVLDRTAFAGWRPEPASEIPRVLQPA